MLPRPLHPVALIVRVQRSGTVEAWREAWGPLLACAENGAPDVAAAAARTLGRTRPAKAAVPAAARRFQPVLVAAGLASTGTDAA